MAPLLVMLASGCALDTTPVALPDLDAARYGLDVQPVVRASCASLDCHGIDGRPLRLYAQDGLRLEASFRGQPLSAAEQQRNVDAFRAVDPTTDRADMHLALLEPLALDAGGVHHEGGDVWASRDDDGYRCVRAWLSGESDEGACARATP